MQSRRLTKVKAATRRQTPGVREFPIDDLLIPFYVRQKPDQDRVLYLAELMEGGVDLDPIKVFPKNGGFAVRDGRHRMEAHRLLDRKNIRAVVYPACRDLINEIALAYKENAGGALPPSKEDTEHTVRLLLSQGVAPRDIAKLIPVPPSMAKRYVQLISMKQLRIRMKNAVSAVSDGELNAPQAAEKFKVDLDQLRKELGGRKKKGKYQGKEVRRVISSRYRSLSQYNATTLRKLFNGLEDGDVTPPTIEMAIKTMADLNRKLGSNLRGWTSRLAQFLETNVNLRTIGKTKEEDDE